MDHHHHAGISGQHGVFGAQALSSGDGHVGAHAHDHARLSDRRHREPAHAPQMDQIPRARTGAHHEHRSAFYPHADRRDQPHHQRAKGARREFRNGRADQARQGDAPDPDPAARERLPPRRRSGRRDGRPLLQRRERAHEI